MIIGRDLGLLTYRIFLAGTLGGCDYILYSALLGTISGTLLSIEHHFVLAGWYLK